LESNQNASKGLISKMSLFKNKSKALFWNADLKLGCGNNYIVEYETCGALGNVGQINLD